MGVVYEALDEKLNQRRALKSAKPGYHLHLAPEARSALRITHDNVCRVYEIHTAHTARGPVDFLAMEYIEGETLAAHVARDGPADGRSAREMARQVVITDFGFAQEELPIGSPTQEASGSLRGAPDYIAPELWEGESSTEKSDLYAMGVVLYEIVTGHNRSCQARTGRRD